MDKITTQTVYVETKEPTNIRVEENRIPNNSYSDVIKLPGRIPLTPQELAELMAECVEAVVKRGENITVFLNSKGIIL